MKKTIYVMSNGNLLRRVGRRLILEKSNKKIFEIPTKDVGRILLFGRTEVTSQTTMALLETEIPILYLRKSGRLRGKVVAATGSHVELRQKQYMTFHQSNIALSLAKSVIFAKIKNMQAVLRYIYRNKKGTAKLIEPLQNLTQKLVSCATPEEIMGCEGAAAKIYFQVYGQSLPSTFCFHVRSRQPAQDPANALLNLGYMVLLREIESHLEAYHLDPYLGFLHSTAPNRASLALDILEEFRQPAIDLFILKLLNLQQLENKDFVKDNGVTMTEEGIKKFFELYENHLGKSDGEAVGFHKIIDNQIANLVAFLQKGQRYSPFVLESEDIGE